MVKKVIYVNCRMEFYNYEDTISHMVKYHKNDVIWNNALIRGYAHNEKKNNDYYLDLDFNDVH